MRFVLAETRGSDPFSTRRGDAYSRFPDRSGYLFQVSGPTYTPTPRFPDQRKGLFQVSRQKQASYDRNRTANLESRMRTEDVNSGHEPPLWTEINSPTPHRRSSTPRAPSSFR